MVRAQRERKIVRYDLESPWLSFRESELPMEVFIGLTYRFFEASDGFAERFAQLGELTWTENHQGNYKNNDQFWHTKAPEHASPPDEEDITLCFGVRDVNLVTGVEIWPGTSEFWLS
jgi:hypothetical protein